MASLALAISVFDDGESETRNAGLIVARLGGSRDESSSDP
jgi:hypothetical protein